MGRWLLIVAVSSLFGCREKLVSTRGELMLTPSSVTFQSAYVRQNRSAEVQVSNTGRAPTQVTISTEGPFSADESNAQVPGGGTVTVHLKFRSLTEGHFEAPLKIVSDDGVTLEGKLIGDALAAPQCMSPSPCLVSQYDEIVGGCVEKPANDGLDCNNVCFSSARCLAGECLGTPKTCDDGNACTTDFCEASTGCVHFPATARCAASSDPCQVPLCDPKVGCTLAPASDGTRCGPSDCSTARVCISGLCKTFPVTDGAACGDLSPCQARGRCSEGACIRPPASQLEQLWTVWAPPGERVEWDSIADDDGNIYFREAVRDAVTARLRSVSALGKPRWSVTVDSVVQVALIHRVLVIRKPSGYEGRSPDDGRLLWKTELSNSSVTAFTKANSRGPGGALYVGYVVADGGTLLGSTVASLNAFNGEPLWQQWLPSMAIDDQTMPVDENGYTYVGATELNGSGRYLAFTPGGVRRWSKINPHGNPAAVFGGRVYHWDHWISETSDGTWVNEKDPELFGAGYPRLALGAINFVGIQTVDAGSCVDPAQTTVQPVWTLVRVNPSNSQKLWEYTMSAPSGAGHIFTNPVLVSSSSVIFSQNQDYCGKDLRFVLKEVSTQGEPGFSCPLPDEILYLGEGLLSNNRWIAAVSSPDGGQWGVRAIALPGFELPEHGWATAWGSSARDNHSR